MSTSTFTPPPAGTRVYSRDGATAEYVAHTKDGHLVKEGVTYYSADPDIGEDTSFEKPAFWHEFFLKPPVEKLHEEVAQLNAQVEKLRNDLSTVRKEQWDLDREIKARKDRITQHEKLKQLDDFIAGKITHLVIQDMGYWDTCREVKIVSLKDAVETKDDWGHRELKLLVLFGDSKGDLTWGINRYSAESGHSKDVITPCLSLEEAQTVAAELLTEHWAAWHKDQKAKDVRSAESLIVNSEKLGFPVPQIARDQVKAERLEKKRQAVVKAEEELVKARTALETDSDVGGPVAPRAI